MEIKTNILKNLADKIGEEHQRVAAVADQIEAPWDVTEVPNTISADERAMLCQAADGVSWPADTAEHIHGKDEELRHDCKLDRFAALKNDAATEALTDGGFRKPKKEK